MYNHPNCCIVFPIIRKFIHFTHHSESHFNYSNTIYSVFKVPETPIWLLSKHRDEEALRALQWLRGWVSEEEIKKEFNELKNYREYANACLECRLSKNQCTHPLPTLWQKFTALFQSSSMKPMLIITVCTFFTSVIGAHSLNPYLAQILNTFQTPLEPTKSSVSYIDSTTIIINYVGLIFKI